jgi:hypothetical protein
MVGLRTVAKASCPSMSKFSLVSSVKDTLLGCVMSILRSEKMSTKKLD